jgi:hypothetical protein
MGDVEDNSRPATIFVAGSPVPAANNLLTDESVLRGRDREARVSIPELAEIFWHRADTEFETHLIRREGERIELLHLREKKHLVVLLGRIVQVLDVALEKLGDCDVGDERLFATRVEDDERVDNVLACGTFGPLKLRRESKIALDEAVDRRCGGNLSVRRMSGGLSGGCRSSGGDLR